jgi:hypothetical protein
MLLLLLLPPPLILLALEGLVSVTHEQLKPLAVSRECGAEQRQQ